MTAPVSLTDLENVTLDVATIATCASVGTTATTVTNRTGVVIDTLRGRLLKLGAEIPVAYAGAISFLVNDEAKTIDRNNTLYAPYPSELPFTTSGTWVGDDEDKFYAFQTSVDTITTDINDLITLTGVAANATTLGTFTGTVISDNLDIKDTIQELGDVVEETIDSNWELLTTVTPTAVNKITTDVTSYTGYTKYKLVLSNIRQNSGTPAQLFLRINNVNTASSYFSTYIVAADPVVAAGTDTDTKVELLNDALMVTADRLWSTIEIQGIYSLLPTQFTCSTSYSTDGLTKNVYKSVQGITASTAVLETIELLWSGSVDFNASGAIRLYGSKQ